MGLRHGGQLRHCEERYIARERARGCVQLELDTAASNVRAPQEEVRCVPHPVDVRVQIQHNGDEVIREIALLREVERQSTQGGRLDSQVQGKNGEFCLRHNLRGHGLNVHRERPAVRFNYRVPHIHVPEDVLGRQQRPGISVGKTEDRLHPVLLHGATSRPGRSEPVPVVPAARRRELHETASCARVVPATEVHEVVHAKIASLITSRRVPVAVNE